MQGIPIEVQTATGKVEIQVAKGSNLRRALLDNGLTPYAPLTQKLNCGGRGLCATCGVWITEGEPEPSHWHDKAARRFGYPRLACQISVVRPMKIQLVDKWIWGKRWGRVGDE